MGVEMADRITGMVDALLVQMFGDVPRFVEVWRNDDEPLTQWYAPHGWPRDR